jgi:hypothetical protein
MGIDDTCLTVIRADAPHTFGPAYTCILGAVITRPERMTEATIACNFLERVGHTANAVGVQRAETPPGTFQITYTRIHRTVFVLPVHPTVTPPAGIPHGVSHTHPALQVRVTETVYTPPIARPDIVRTGVPRVAVLTHTEPVGVKSSLCHTFHTVAGFRAGAFQTTWGAVTDPDIAGQPVPVLLTGALVPSSFACIRYTKLTVAGVRPKTCLAYRVADPCVLLAIRTGIV